MERNGHNNEEERDERVGVAWVRTSRRGSDYFAIRLTRDLPEGQRVLMFKNNTEARTDASPDFQLVLPREPRGERDQPPMRRAEPGDGRRDQPRRRPDDLPF